MSGGAVASPASRLVPVRPLCLCGLGLLLLQVVVGLCDCVSICAIMVYRAGEYRVSCGATRRAGLSVPPGLDKSAMLGKIFFLCTDANHVARHFSSVGRAAHS